MNISAPLVSSLGVLGRRLRNSLTHRGCQSLFLIVNNCLKRSHLGSSTGRTSVLKLTVRGLSFYHKREQIRIPEIMSIVELLETRVAELEKQMYGSNNVPSIDDPLPESCMVDSLLHANTLITSALSGRDKTNALVKRLPELNEMLDPTYDGIDLHAEAKLELVMAMESEIREYAESVDRLNELKPVLELDHIEDVPDLSPKLSQLTLSYLQCHKESEVLTKNIWNVFSEYNNIITSIAKTMIGLDAAVTAAEIAAAPKKQLD